MDEIIEKAKKYAKMFKSKKIVVRDNSSGK